MRRDRHGFSLLELMIVIVIIGVLAAGALQYYVNSIDDAKEAKAKLDCDTLAQAVNKYEQLENVELESLSELKAGHIANIDTLKDPWGNPYAIDRQRGTVLSRGPDGKHAFGDPKHAVNRDDVEIVYSPGILLLSAKLEGGSPDEEGGFRWSSALRLTFSKKVRAVRDIDFDADIAGGKSTFTLDGLMGSGQADPGCPRYAFRFYLDSPKRPLDSQAKIKPFYAHWLTGEIALQLPCAPTFLTPYTWSGRVTEAEYKETCLAHGLDPEKGPDFGMIYASTIPKEIVIVLPGLAASALNTGRYLVNLTGTRKNADEGRGNPVFQAVDGALGAQMSASPVRIR